MYVWDEHATLTQQWTFLQADTDTDTDSDTDTHVGLSIRVVDSESWNISASVSSRGFAPERKLGSPASRSRGSTLSDLNSDDDCLAMPTSANTTLLLFTIGLASPMIVLDGANNSSADEGERGRSTKFDKSYIDKFEVPARRSFLSV